LKILLTADLHLKKGIRTDVGLNYLDYLEKYYIKHDLKYLIFLGDILDKSSSIKNEMFIPLSLKLYDMKEKGINMIFLLGNHDIFNVDNDSIVETFAPFGQVIKETTVLNILGEEVIFLPYTKKVEDIEELDSLTLFTHLSIADFSFDNNYHATEKIAFPKKMFERFDKVITGHFHRHQEYKNITYIGSPFQMNRGEIDQLKGFMVMEMDTLETEFIVYNEAPTYINISMENIKNLDTMDLTNKIAVINVDRKIEDFAKLRYILLEKGVVDILPVFEVVEDDLTLVEDVKLNNNLEDIVKEYIIEQNKEFEEDILFAFNKVLEEV